MMHLKDHLEINEKILLKKRISRKSFLAEYVGIGLTLFIALLIGYYRLTSWLNTQYSLAATYTILFMLTIIVVIIFLIRIEYKIWSKAYAITSNRVIISDGLFKEEFKSFMYDTITDIEVQQIFLDKILNTGTIILKTTEGYDLNSELKSISQPFNVKKQIMDQKIISKSNPKDVGKKVEHYYRPMVEK
jgi:membrane protein YdbS with pleckstrin-like domain